MTILQAATAAQEASISVEPAYTEVWQGENFTVNITVDSAEYDIYAASYTLYFNNTLLNATSLEKGPFLTQDGNSSDIQEPPTGIDNTAGEIKYGEYRMGAVPGITGYGVLTTITFQVIGEEGISQLNLSDLNLALLYSAPPDFVPVPTTLNNGRVGIAQTQSPFVISGYVSYDGGSDCNDPTVNITNLNTSEECTAETNVTSNYYQTMLSSCADVVAGEILRFDVTSPDGSSNITEHTVTQDEVGDGGFELNITLEGSGVFDPVITSCNDTGAAQDGFCPDDSVWVNGTGLAPNTEYKLWIQPDPVNNSDTLNASDDPSGPQETVTTGADGSFGPIEIWSAIPAGSPMNYDIVVDNMNDTYNAADDGIDSANGVVGIIAPIPELATFALIGVGLMLVVGLMRFGRKKR